MRVFAASLRWDIGDRTLNKLKQRLLNAFAGHIAGYRLVFAFTSYLVNFINKNNSALCAIEIVIGGLEQFREDVFNIFAHIASFCESGGIRQSQRYIQQIGESLGQKGFACTCRPK